jgi:hypothetical protein
VNEVPTFVRAVAEELQRARERQKPFNSLHEAYAVLLEEMEEFWEEVRLKCENRDPLRILQELVQIASVCQSVAEDDALLKGDHYRGGIR